MKAMTLGVPIYTIAYGRENRYIDLHGKREPVPVERPGDEADRSGSERGVFRGGHGRIS